MLDSETSNVYELTTPNWGVEIRVYLPVIYIRVIVSVKFLYILLEKLSFLIL